MRFKDGIARGETEKIRQYELMQDLISLRQGVALYRDSSGGTPRAAGRDARQCDQVPGEKSHKGDTGNDDHWYWRELY